MAVAPILPGEYKRAWKTHAEVTRQVRRACCTTQRDGWYFGYSMTISALSLGNPSTLFTAPLGYWSEPEFSLGSPYCPAA